MSSVAFHTRTHTRSTTAYLGTLSLAQKFHLGDRGQALTSSTNQLPANRQVNDSKSSMSSCWMIRPSVDDCIIDWQLPGHMLHSLPMPTATSRVNLFWRLLLDGAPASGYLAMLRQWRRGSVALCIVGKYWQGFASTNTKHANLLPRCSMPGQVNDGMVCLLISCYPATTGLHAASRLLNIRPHICLFCIVPLSLLPIVW